MRKLLILPVALVTAVLVSPAALAAEPGGRHLRTVMTVSGPEGESALLGCREPAHVGHAWRLFFRIDNTEGTEAIRGAVAVRQDHDVVSRRAIDRTAPGEESPVVSLRAPRGEDVVLRTSLRSRSGGSAGIGPLVLGRC